MKLTDKEAEGKLPSAFLFAINGGERGTRTLTGLAARRASNAVPYQLGDLSVRKSNGGEGGIRTHGTREGTTVFETATIDHSVTSPREKLLVDRSYFCRRCLKKFCSNARHSSASTP